MVGDKRGSRRLPSGKRVSGQLGRRGARGSAGRAWPPPTSHAGRPPSPLFALGRTAGGLRRRSAAAGPNATSSPDHGWHVTRREGGGGVLVSLPSRTSLRGSQPLQPADDSQINLYSVEAWPVPIERLRHRLPQRFGRGLWEWLKDLVIREGK